MTTLPLPARAPGRAPAGRREQTSTRLVFLVVGLAQGAWAPLVPFAKARLGADDGALGLLLLCLGVGSIIAMPVTGALTARLGCRRMILVAGVVFVLTVPALASLSSWAGLALALALFGASLGTADVAMNLQAVLVERDARRPMMSGFHALFSLGGILGAALVSLLLWANLTGPLGAAWVTAAAGLALLALSAPGLLPYGDDVPEDGGPAPFLVVPRGAVVVIGILCLLAFLGEGAVLDWSAVFLRTERGVDPSLAGLGYAMFSVAMTVGRFTGDAVRTWLGETRVLFWGGVLSAAGFLVAVLVPVWWLDLAGFLLVGVGAANIVPVLFSATGRTRSMPPGLAIASVTTLGYAGILAGPAALGFIARATDLSVSLALVALAMLAVGLCRRVAER